MKIEYNLKDKVIITSLKREGIIKSIWITSHGIQYEVRYFDNAEAKQIYFYADELKKVNK